MKTQSILKRLSGLMMAAIMAFSVIAFIPQLEVKAAVGDNLLSVSSFEDGVTTGLSPHSNANMMTLEVKDGVARTGNKSLYVATKSVAQYRALKLNATVEQGKWYKISAYFKLDNENTTTRQFLAWFLTNGSVYFNQNSNTYTKYKAAAASGSNFSASSDGVSGLNSTDWTEISTIFKAPANSVELKFTHARNSAGENFYLYMDDISLVEVEPETTMKIDGEDAAIDIPTGIEAATLDLTNAVTTTTAGGKTLSYNDSLANSYTLAEDYEGVTYDDATKTLTVTKDVWPGEILLTKTGGTFTYPVKLIGKENQTVFVALYEGGMFDEVKLVPMGESFIYSEDDYISLFGNKYVEGSEIRCFMWNKETLVPLKNTIKVIE